jgi:hypothetical protein
MSENASAEARGVHQQESDVSVEIYVGHGDNSNDIYAHV